MKKTLTFFILCFILIISCSCNSSTSNSNIDIITNNDEEINVLVSYFSQTGNTKRVAEIIHENLDSTLFEIIPTEPYSNEDVNYEDNSRAKIESLDENIRPEIKDKVDNMNQYTHIFIGYPIWYSEAPRVIDTFLESYDFSDKIIIPFCTSGSTGIEQSASNLEGLAPSADWLDGKRFSEDPSEEEVEDWVKSLDIK